MRKIRIHLKAQTTLRHVAPFGAVFLAYESFRLLSGHLIGRVNYGLAPAFDRQLFGSLPTRYLQDRLWNGTVRWYDVLLYFPYVFFFVAPVGMAILVWRTRTAEYWTTVTSFVVTFFSAFLTFLIFPTAPPWLASQNKHIEPLTRIPGEIWARAGLHDFPGFYSRVSPNAVAAVPSLHAAISTLTSLVIFKLYGRRWGALSLIYPLAIYFSVVYEAEHYVLDVLVGVVYAFVAYLTAPYVLAKAKSLTRLVR